jgi:hypothetical protein
VVLVRFVWVTVSTVALCMFLAPSLAQVKPSTIKVIGTGKAEGMPALAAWFTTEPSTDPVIIPTRAWGNVGTSDIRRFMRIYFPRTYQSLLDYEFFILAQVDMSFLSGQQQRWLYDALTDYQKGGANTRSAMSVNAGFYVPWRDSILSEAFPNDAVAVTADDRNFDGPSGPLIIRDDMNLPNIIKPYKAMIEPIFQSYGGSKPLFPVTIPKPGSTILSYTKNSLGIGSPIPGQIPHVFYWSWNRSITFTFRDIVYDVFWSAPITGSLTSNPYSLDIIINIVWFSTGRKLPDDPLQVHEYRRDLFEFGIHRSLLTSLLDFAEVFGANPSREYAMLSRVEDIRRNASVSYLGHDFDAAYGTMKEARTRLKELEGDASSLKNRALFWVYVIEWTVVTGAFLVAGFVLWTLMVGRALYHDIAVTRGIE